MSLSCSPLRRCWRFRQGWQWRWRCSLGEGRVNHKKNSTVSNPKPSTNNLLTVASPRTRRVGCCHHRHAGHASDNAQRRSSRRGASPRDSGLDYRDQHDQDWPQRRRHRSCHDRKRQVAYVPSRYKAKKLSYKADRLEESERESTREQEREFR